MRLAVSLSLSCLVVACGSFSGNDSSSDGGVGTTGQSDGGSNGMADASTSPFDSGAPVDAGGPWCLTQAIKHDFCADFDENKTLTDIFSKIEDSSSTGAVTIDGAKGSTHPGSLRLVVPAGQKNLRVFADLVYTPSATGLVCEFDVELDSQPTYVGSLLYLDTGKFTINVGDTLTVDMQQNSATFGLPGKTWVRMGLSWNFKTGNVTVTRGGAPVQTGTGGVMPAGTMPTIGFGSLYATGAFTMRYDNITCDPLP